LELSVPKPHVVIIGSGFGGLFAAKALAHAAVDVTVISKTVSHLFQPLLYQVATGILSTGEVAPATRDVLKRQRNATVLLAEVTAIDLEARRVRAEKLGEEVTIGYDHLIVATGTGQSYFGNDRFATFAPGMKSIDDALELRARIFGSLEMAELTSDPNQRRRLLTFVVVGAGPTGVEMAGQIAELTGHTLRDDYRRIDTTSATVLLLDGVDAVLGSFGPRLSASAKAQLERNGVDVRLGALVTNVDADGLDVRYSDGHTERIEASCKVWAAGVQANPLGRLLAEQSAAETDRAGRVKVLPDLTLPGHPEVFVVGDLASLDSLPGVAQVAIQGGRYAARRIIATVEGTPPGGDFAYHDRGSMAVTSRFGAIAKIGSIELTGFIAWLAWLFVHLLYIVGFKNRVLTLLHWAITFIGQSRAERVTTQQQLVARLAVQQLGDSFSPTISGTMEAGNPTEDAKKDDAH
jgi:NADH dehydrogenase